MRKGGGQSGGDDEDANNGGGYYNSPAVSGGGGDGLPWVYVMEVTDEDVAVQQRSFARRCPKYQMWRSSTVGRCFTTRWASR